MDGQEILENTNLEEAGVAILILTKEDFKTTKIFYNRRRVYSPRWYTNHKVYVANNKA